MEEIFYGVKVGNTVVATNMNLQNALIFTEALFDKYYNEPNMAVTIFRETPKYEVTDAIADSIDTFEYALKDKRIQEV